MSWLDRWRSRAAAAAEGAEERAAHEQLRERARGLAREIEPERDLWLGIRNRIELERTPARPRGLRTRLQVPVWAATAAALLLAVTTVGTGLWLNAGPSLDDPEAVRALANTLRERDGVSGVRGELLALLDERRERLPGEVVAAVERGLAEVDRALVEIHLALLEHPSDGTLGFLLAEAYRREAEMLEQLQWWAQTRPAEASG